jgi:hypothetical protein
MATATLRRSSLGLDSPRGLLWWERAACAQTTHLHTADIRSGVIGADSPQARARHICIAHCPVLDECSRDIADRQPRGVVQAGLIYPDTGTSSPRPARQQPADPGCGSWCAHLREVTR